MTLPTHPLDAQQWLADWRASMASTACIAADRTVSRECARSVPARGHTPNPGSARCSGSPSPSAVDSGRQARTVNGPAVSSRRQGRTLFQRLFS